MRDFPGLQAKRGARSLGVQTGLALLALVILVMPALDLAWNDLKPAERHGVPCPIHANPVLVACPDAVSGSQGSSPREVVGSPLEPQLYDASIFIPPKL